MTSAVLTCRSLARQFIALVRLFEVSILTLRAFVRGGGQRGRCTDGPTVSLTKLLRVVLLLRLLHSTPAVTARADVNLATWNKPGQGFDMRGAIASDGLGDKVAGAGDVNNDGYHGVLIGAHRADISGKTDAGAAYLVFGSSSRSVTAIDTANALSPYGIKILGGAAGDGCGRYVSGVEDFNNDGVSDFVVGVPYFTPSTRTQAGAAVVIFGKTSGWTDINLASFVSGSAGFWLYGAAAGDRLGYVVSAGGDTNGDGIGDVVVGANLADPLTRVDAGSSYVIFGHSTATSFSTIDLSTFSSGSKGFKYTAVQLVIGAEIG
jgi:hypothetical protein